MCLMSFALGNHKQPHPPCHSSFSEQTEPCGAPLPPISHPTSNFSHSCQIKHTCLYLTVSHASPNHISDTLHLYFSLPISSAASNPCFLNWVFFNLLFFSIGFSSIRTSSSTGSFLRPLETYNSTMASLGSLSFLVETTMDNSLLFPITSNRRPPRFSPVGFHRKDFFDYGLSIGRLRLSKSLRATGRSISKGENEDESDVELQATIEKSKKVLSMQKNLLQQIEERKKLVSSIKNSIISTPQEQVSNNGNYNSFSKLDPPSTDREFIHNYRDENLSESYTDLTTFGTSEAPFMSASGDFDKEKQPEKISQLEEVSSAEDPLKELNGTARSTVVPSFIPLKSESYNSMDDELEELKEAIEEDVSVVPDTAPEDDDAKPPPLAGANVMNVILVAAECAPWSKTGGLGDVAAALPKALARRGHRVMVVVPRYGDYRDAQDTGVCKRYSVNGEEFEVSYFQAYIDGVDFVFIDSNLFHHRESNIYGGEHLDILKRMVLFCKAAVEVPWYVPCGGVCYGDGNLVFVANDWHTALLPVYLKAYYRDHGLMKYTRSVLVIHNIAHQGRGPVEDFFHVDLPEHYMNLFTLNDPIGGEHFNIFAAGLKTADRIVTVSHGYSWELKTSEGGWGLHGIINENDWKLRGIVNGIDPEEWSPEVDAHLKSDDGYTNYSLETLKTGKSKCKAALQKELGLPVREQVPVIGFIGRLDQQKGVDLIAEAIPWMVGQDVQLVMLGTGRPDLENMLRQFESQNHDKVRGWVGFSVKMAHRITAGADILLMPSRFEPCGLNQLYAMSYGTVPVVHAVGGLRDTVQPFDPYKESGLGWTFDRAESHKLIHALGNCLYTFREFKSSWEGLQRRAMNQDLSWDGAAQHYEEVLVAAKYQW